MTQFYSRNDVNYSGDVYSIPFKYIHKKEVKVYIDDELWTKWHFLNTNQLTLDEVPEGIGYNNIVSVRRETDIEEKVVTYDNNSLLNKENLNKSQDQLIYAVQEIYDNNIQNNIDIRAEVDEKVERVSDAVEKLEFLEDSVEIANEAALEATEQAQIATEKAEETLQTYETAMNDIDNLLANCIDDLNSLDATIKKDADAIINRIGISMFDTILKDHVLTYEESKGLALQGTYVYKDAIAGERYGYSDFYNKCLEEYAEATGTETVNGVTVKVHSNGHKFYDIANKTAIDNFFNTMGSAWFYGVDIENERVFLPRNNFFEQMTSNVAEVGDSVKAGLPNITGYIQDNNQYASVTSADGVFERIAISNSNYIGTNAQTGAYTKYTFDASRSSSIYGKSNTVQPNAVKKLLYICVGNTVADTSWVDVVTQVEGGVKDIEEAKDEAIDELKNITGGTVPLGFIGSAILGIDETLGLQRYLNGQIIIQDQFKGFTKFLKRRIELYPSLACTELEWQTAVTMSAFSQCGKFVIDDNAGTIRLPKVVNIQGLTDLSKLGEIVEAGLPNIAGTFTTLELGYHGHEATSGALYSFSGNTGGVPHGGGGTSAGLGIDASRSNSVYGNSNTVQQEQIQYPYFIQVATGAETEDNIINEIELNNPYSLGDSKYSPVALNNLSWLKSEGQWNSKAVYPAYYDWILTNVNNGVEGFIGNTMYMWGSASGGYMCQTLTPKVGSPIWGYDSKAKVGYVTKVYDTGELDFIDNRHNVSYIKIGRYSPSDESSNAYITDYDFVLNTAEEAFRLPLKNGEEYAVANNAVNKGTIQSGYVFDRNCIAYFRYGGNGNTQCQVLLNNTEVTYFNYTGNTSAYGVSGTFRANRGDVLTYSGVKSADNMLIVNEMVGNGSLYFYVGETVQNANLINAGRIEEVLSTKTDKVQASQAGMPSNRYIDLTLGASGTTYTAPANGWVYVCKTTGQTGITYLRITNLTRRMVNETTSTSGNASAPSIFIPVVKGDKFQVTYNMTGSTNHFEFIYAEGEV